MTQYTIDKRFTTRVTRSARVLEIAEAFGLGLDDKEFVIFDNLSSRWSRATSSTSPGSRAAASRCC
jgi:hypothetical protein